MFILFGATYHTSDSMRGWITDIDRIYTKRASLVVVFSNIKVFLRPNGVLISLRQSSMRGWIAGIRQDLHEACSLFLRSFDFRLVAG